MEPAMFRFVSLLAFCFLVSGALMLGYYGEVEVAIGPGCSLLVQPSSVFVKGIKVSAASGPQVSDGGLMLYGLAGAPPMDVPAERSETRRVVVPANFHREWVYFLNKGARIEAAYSVDAETDVPYPLCIVIAQGKESFIKWTEEPTEHNTALSWHLVQGTGTIEQNIDQSSEYYIAVHNLNDHQDTTVQLNIRIRTLIYNTTGAEYRCSPAQHVCTYRVPFVGPNVAVLSSDIRKRLDSDEQRVKLSYEPRWIVYVVGSAILAIVLMLLYEIVSMLFDPCDRGGRGGVERRTPLLTSKEDDSASLGSSYDSVSHDDDDDDGAAERGADGGGDEGCVVCRDARKDCFFLPCGHSATCYACGARIVEEHGSCPLCRRKLKKAKRIFVV
ncbi:hypothetical protein EJB05_36772 [Eragrostis curvula]|uniref:RING-type domain-containing protein n=1 Tax=Eragrostis curvula TaxID=38414 RepID=A0A5J9UBM6_9POAL|nr:hypothetical protein EJB05_36772 [Eragrostis curvula]